MMEDMSAAGLLLLRLHKAEPVAALMLFLQSVLGLEMKTVGESKANFELLN